MALRCPNCGTPMETMDVSGVEIDVCPSCHGVWLDEGELKALASLEPRAFEGLEHILVPPVSEDSQQLTPTTSERLCPRCGTKLFSYRYGGNSDIIIDGCETCGGIWLDAGELKKILDYMHELEKPLSPEEMAIVKTAIAQSQLRMKAIEDDIARSSILVRIARALRKLGLR